VNNVQFEPCGEDCYVLSGALTFATVPQIYTQGSTVFDSNGLSLTLDLQGVMHTDSAGLALMMEWMRTAQSQEKEIHFKNVPAQMLNIARLSGLDSILPLN
jgi:phospholipid transport system transporter-binding protein